MLYRDLLIQEKQWRHVQGAFAAGRLAHAYLFHGPGGSGKEAHAIELAALVNCLEPGSNGACGYCAACIKMNNLQHPNLQLIVPFPRRNPLGRADSPLKALRPVDLDALNSAIAAKARDPYSKIQLEGAKSILINSVRQIRRESMLTRAEKGWRAILIFEAERLCVPQPAAANALLKILEEPPEQTLFVLVTDRPNLLLDTIRSRCMGLHFPALADDRVIGYLTSQHDLSPEEAQVLTAVTGGNLIQARKLVASEESVGHSIGQFVDALLKPRPAGWQQLTNDLALMRRSKQLEFNYRMGLLQLFLRDLMIMVKTGDPTRLIFRDHEERMAGIMSAFPRADWGDGAAAVEEALNLLDRNVNPTLVFTNLLLDIRDAARGMRRALAD